MLRRTCCRGFLGGPNQFGRMPGRSLPLEQEFIRNEDQKPLMKLSRDKHPILRWSWPAELVADGDTYMATMLPKGELAQHGKHVFVPKAKAKKLLLPAKEDDQWR